MISRLAPCVVLGLAVCPGAAPASFADDLDDLASVIPGDALAYIGWAGDHAVDRLFGSWDPSWSPEAAEAAITQSAALDDSASAFWVAFIRAHTILSAAPGAIALLDVRPGDELAAVDAAFVVRAGAQVKRLDDLVIDVVEMFEIPAATRTTIGGHPFGVARMDDVPLELHWGAFESYYLVTTSRKAVETMFEAIRAGGPGLSADAELAHCRMAVRGRDDRRVIAAFANVPRILQALDSAMTAEGARPIGPILEVLGIAPVRSAYGQLSDEGGTLRVAAYLHVPRPRTGLLRAWEQQPIDDDAFAFVPADAHFAQAFNWDLGATLDAGLDIFKQLDPEGFAKFEGARAGDEGEDTAASLRNLEALIRSFEPAWVLYDAPSHGGIAMSGSVLVADVKDVDAHNALLAGLINRAIDALDTTVVIGLRPVTCDGRSMTQLFVNGVVFPIAPSWGYVGSRCVFGLFPQTVAAAMREVDPATRRGSLLESTAFKSLRERLPASVQAVGYANNRHYLHYFYAPVLLRSYLESAALGDLAGVLDSTPPGTFAEMSSRSPVGVGVTVADDDGIHYAMLGPGVMGPAVVGTAALVTSIALPSLQRARELSKRTVSAANLRGIGQACMVYAAEHDDRFPADVNVLLQDGVLTAKLLHAPSDENWQPGALSYTYIGGQSPEANPGNVVAYEHPSINDGEGANVLFIDGHVEFMRGDALTRVIRDTYTRLGRPHEIPDFAR